MKKKLLFILSLTFFTLVVSSLPANAMHFKDVVISADCDGYSIMGTACFDWRYHENGTLAYSFLLNGIEVVSEVEDFVVDLDSYSCEPFEFAGSWVPPCGEVTVEGMLEWSAMNLYTGQIEGDTASYGPEELDCPCDEEWCARTPGFWKTHPGAWPVDELSIGSDDYTKEQLLVMLWQPVRGNMDTILIKHLIAAKLNVLSGSDADSIEQTINDADACLAGSCDKDSAEELKDILDEFNNSGDCD
jgi:hypothetical protein